ncbi:MAG TPA: zinc metallopeptidase, partial [Chloroflexota bacterium]|nr:zinc metallopeptidase [Chloroflexota bacterium]
MFFLDPMYFVFALPALLLALYASWKVRSTYSKYAQVPNSTGMTGAEVARRLLDAAGLHAVQIERVPGELTDHYDPGAKVLRLSDSNYASYSVAA